MSAKKPATPETAITEAQIQIDKLTKQNDDLVQHVEMGMQDLTQMKKENGLLITAIDSLLQENDHMLEELANEPQPLLASVSSTRDIKTEMLLATLPALIHFQGLDHPHSMAQKALDAVNVIMETWGLSDGNVEFSMFREIITEAVEVVLERSGDIDTEDGSFATTDTSALLRLQMAISNTFNLDSDDVDVSDRQKIKAILDSMK